MVSTCYRSKWRLHEDKSILTVGRYYRAADDAPAVPFATYLGSREWTPDKENQEWGEWGGVQEYDQGVPPRVLPTYSVIGGDCMSKLLPAPAAGTAATQLGRCVHMANQSICGNVLLYANFSVAYDNGEITYYEQNQVYLSKDKGEGEWIGAVPGKDFYARVRVTELTPTTRDWRFDLVDFGGGSTDECVYCPDGTHDPWVFTMAGTTVTWAGVDPDVFNGTFSLDHAMTCFWYAYPPGVTLQLVTGLPLNWYIIGTILATGDVMFVYTAFIDCVGPVTLTLDSAAPEMAGLPATIVMHG